MSPAALPFPEVALLGDGVIASEHAAALTSLNVGIRVVLGTSRDKVQTFAEKHSIQRWSTNIDEVLSDERVSAVIVASPNEAHVPQTLAALASKKSVLCEVPLATSLPGAREVSSKANEAGLICVVGHSNRWLPPLPRLRSLREAGRLEVRQIITVTGLLRRHDKNMGMDGKPREWFDSVIWHHGSHVLDTALWLLDETVESVRATAGNPNPVDGRPLDVSIVLETRAGGFAVMTLSYSSNRPISEMIIISDDQTCWMSDLVLRDSAGAKRGGEGGAATSAIKAAITAQDEAFMKSVVGTATPSPTPSELLPMFEILDNVERQVEARLTKLATRGSSNDNEPISSNP